MPVNKTLQPWTPVFIECLLAEGLLQNGNTKVRQELIKQQHATLLSSVFSYDELIEALSEDGFLVSSNAEFIEFSKKVFHLDTSYGEDTCDENNNNLRITDSDGESSTESSSSSSNGSIGSVSDENSIADILSWFVENDLISVKNRVVTRNAFQEAVKTNYAQWRMTEDQLMTAFKSNGFIESVRQQMCTFSIKVFADKPNSGQLKLEITHRLTYYRHFDSEFGASPNHCIVCREKFLVAMLLERHMTEVHGEPFEIPVEVPNGIVSNCFQLKFTDNINDKLYLSVRNLKRRPLTMVNIFYLCSHQFVKIETSVSGIEIAPDELLQFFVPRDLFTNQSEVRSVLLVFQNDVEYVEHFHMKAQFAIQPLESPLVVPEPVDPASCTKRTLKRFKLEKLDTAPPSKEIISLFNNFFEVEARPVTELEMFVCTTIRSFIDADPKQRLNAVNYVDLFSYCIQIDDCGQERQMMAFDRVQHIEKAANGCYRLNFDTLSELPPDIREGGLIALRKISPTAVYLEGIDQQVVLKIVCLEQDHLLMRQTGVAIRRRPSKTGPGPKKPEIDVAALYNVRFKDNRMPARMEHQALEIVMSQKLERFFFPSKPPAEKSNLIEGFNWFNANISNNPEQMQAVKSIVNGTAFPAPYIIFGPPGTGKTATIVETIGQLWKMVTNSRILVTAQSNAACDEIAKRLLNILPRGHIYRFYARSFENKQDRIDEVLIDLSNLRTGQHEYPGYNEFYAYRVVICTLITAGRLVLANLNPHHFTHVFIDECASSTEVTSLIPIAGIVTTKKRVLGNIILAGDIQQLGPILRTGFTNRLSYDKTLMERLMELPIYQKDPQTKKFNPNLITKLVYSFRSHPKIIEFSNKTFYDGDLIAKGPPDSTHWAINWRWLPKQNFPIIFEPVYGESKKDDFFFSSYNDEEIVHVLRYVQRILNGGLTRRSIGQADIGIISPYKKQCQKIGMRCRLRGWTDIEVGTVEIFQGREKPIIIVSTVRSGAPNVGFLNNPKRLNVTVTRAKALMIIIGNPITLQSDPYWYDLLKYCQDNGGCTKHFELARRPQHSNTVIYGPAEFFYHYRLAHKNQNVYVGDFF